MTEPNSKEALGAVLQEYWGFDAFRPLQEASMTAILRGRDSLVVLPTGGGKSLCFQAPAVVMPGMALVISPLLSLMKDQVDALKTNGVSAAKIDSTLTAQERRHTHELIQRRALKLLYVSPERVVKPGFIEYLREAGVSSIVIDEAHCISQWGHDFRPEYRTLRCLRDAFPELGMHAFTATATKHVQDDIVSELALRNPDILIGTFDRPNLRYRVERRSDSFAQIRSVIDAHPGESGIVYTTRRDDVMKLCGQLDACGHKALPYHAGMDDAARRRNQEAFSNEKADIVVATVAFGMGIDKSNVRYVVHATMPKSIEHYQQETGRAGRDGLSADCVLFYSFADFKLWENIIEKNEGEGSEIAVRKLRDMFDFCERHTCRHAALSRYFAQPYPGDNCSACDVCADWGDGSEVFEEAEEVARLILETVRAIGGFAGPSYTVLVLSGSREDRVRNKRHDRLPGYGSLGHYDARDIRTWIEQLVAQGYLDKLGEYNILSVTAKANASGGPAPRLSPPSMAQRSSPKPRMRKVTASIKDRGPLSPLEQTLFSILKQVRRQKAEELGVAPYAVFSDLSLRDMAYRKPRSERAFLEVHGVGQRKWETFGEEFCTVIREFLDTPDAIAPHDFQ